MMDDTELMPNPERVIEGLRDTGYSFPTAIADIVDNSVAANATRIAIRISLLPNKKDVVVSIADNGIGMDAAGLKNAMRYGSEERADPSSLGKFGLGLKTASTAFCRRLSLISRGQSDDTARKDQWDLDYVAKVGKWMLRNLEPTEDDLELLDEVADGSHGTLVMWEAVDRLLSRDYKRAKDAENAVGKIREELKFHLSLVFQRFLDKNDKRASDIDISVDDEMLLPWDPFCLSEAKTDTLATKKLNLHTVGGSADSTAPCVLTAYAIPRPEEFSTPEARANARVSVDNLGFYVYRENRLIFYGGWLGMYRVDSHSALCRVDFSFDHCLDEVFNIDIKKSRVLLADTLFEYIRDQFMPAPKRAADEKYRKGENVTILKTAAAVHDSSNKNIETNGPKAEQAKVLSTDSKNNLVTFQNTKGTFTHKIVVEDDAEPDKCRVMPKENLEDGVLWLPCIADQKHAVQINTSHPYYKKVYYPVRSQSVMVTGMDALLWALSEAELGTYDENTKGVYSDIRIQVSYALKKLLQDLPDPKTDEEQGE